MVNARACAIVVIAPLVIVPDIPFEMDGQESPAIIAGNVVFVLAVLLLLLLSLLRGRQLRHDGDRPVELLGISVKGQGILGVKYGLSPVIGGPSSEHNFARISVCVTRGDIGTASKPALRLRFW